ncbi:hypothetical protein ACTG9Q_28535 [Actinokineospora sp. 24-640]
MVDLLGHRSTDGLLAAVDRARAPATGQHQLRDQRSRIASQDHDATAWVGGTPSCAPNPHPGRHVL